MKLDDWYLRHQIERERLWREVARTFDFGVAGWLALTALLVWGLMTL